MLYLFPDEADEIFLGLEVQDIVSLGVLFLAPQVI